MSATETPDRLQASHESRSRFQSLAYNIAICVVILFCGLLLIGIALPPPALDTKAGDWGQAIINKAVAAWPAIAAALAVLGGFLGATLARGAHDARLDCNGSGP